MRPIRRLASVASLALLASACGSDTPASTNTTKIDPSMSQTAISSAFSGAAADSTIEMAAGTYHFTNSLNLASKNNITVKGAGAAQTILDFSGQTAGADGVVQSVPAGSTVKVTFQDFAIQDTAGDGIKVTGGNGVHVKGVNVSWPTRATHGGYGVYPVQSKQVLIENCAIDGASDTGIYVGQSDGIVVRNNTLTNNVAGIEIENSFNSDVTGNNSHNNTAGFLVFDLPGLPQVGGHNHRVYGNQFVNNNHPNFGDPSGTVALIPAGTGGVVMANSKVEIFNNTFSGNDALGVGIVSCYVALSQSACSSGGAGYNPFPSEVNVHDNTFTGNGTDPLAANTDMAHPSFTLAALLASGFPASAGDPGWHNGHVSNVSFDGIVGPGSGTHPICTSTNGTETFNVADLHLDQFDSNAPNLPAILEFDKPDYACTLPALPPVPVPAL
jgi:parallel beta-helix repeat protein